MKESDDKTAESICALVLLVGMPVWIAWHGLAVSVLWGWFAVPLLGAPVIGVVGGAGLSLLAQCMRPVAVEKKPLERLAQMVVGPPLWMAFGYVLRWVGNIA